MRLEKDPVPESSSARRQAEEAYDRGVDLVAAGDFPAAAVCFRESLRLDSGFLDALHGLIRALQDAGELDAALAAAHELAQRDPDDVLAHTRLSILYQMKGLVPEAEAEASKAKILGWKQELALQKAARAQEGPDGT